MLRLESSRILLVMGILWLIILSLSGAVVVLPVHGSVMVRAAYASSVGSMPPLLTNASVIDSGAFSTRSWVTEKHVYSSTGVPSNGTLVEMRDAVLSNVLNGAASQDCNDSSDKPPLPSGQWCDSTADPNDGSGTVHIEIDQVYKYLGIAPADWPGNGTKVNITGYTFYDGEFGGSPKNPVPGGWEIHPVTAWSLSNASTEFVLTVSSGSGGTTNPGPGSYSLASGSTVTVTASPSSSFSFNGFTLDGSVSTANPAMVIMNRNHVISASFVANDSPSQSPLSLWFLEELGVSAVVTVLGVSLLKARRSDRKKILGESEKSQR